MENIHILPTDKPSRLLRGFDGIRLFENEVSPDNQWCVNVNIHVTNDEEIKDGDKRINNYQRKPKGEEIPSKKIILTTDQDLIKDGIQAINDEFLQWFVKNPSCERVEVESKVTKDGVWTDLKGYIELPTTHSIIHKIIIPKEEPKQETLEEVAEKYATNHGMMAYVFPEKKESFIQGAKWQKEQDKNKYSEEEVVKLLIKFNQEIQEVENVREWFEEFKKK
jgi:hypothetical protein